MSLRVAAVAASELLTDHRPHGEGLICFEILSRLARRGHAVSAFSPEVDIRGEVPGLTTRQVPRRAALTMLEPFAYASRARAELAALGPQDIVHWVLPFDPTTGFALDPERGEPLVLGPYCPAWPPTQRHGPRATAAELARRLLAPRLAWRHRRTLALAKHVMVTSPGLLAGLPRATLPRASVVPYGVDTTVFRPQPGRRRAAADFTVLFLGNLVPRKGLGHLLRAMPRLLSEVPRARLVVAGGPARSVGEYRTVAQALRVEERVEFLGPVSRDEAPGLYQRADVFCLPSVAEPFGMAAVEAMACGLPVVATRSGGLAEVLVEGEEALLVPAGAPERLAAALVELAQDGRRRLEMGLASRHAAVERFDWERVVDRVEEAYRAAIAGRAA